MKKLLPLFVMLIMAYTASAQQFKWKEVKSTMTTVPEDYYDGATRADAKDYLFDDLMAEGAIYGAPQEGLFCVVHWDSDWENLVDEQQSWDVIVESGLMYYYPASLGGGNQSDLVLDENSEDNINDLFEDGDSYSKVTLNRQMSAYLNDGTTKRWHTLALPFAMSADQVEENFGWFAKVMKYVGEDGNTLKFETASSIEYGGFYLIQIDEDITKIEVSGNVTMSTLYNYTGFDYSLVVLKEVSYVDNIMNNNYVLVNNELRSAEDEYVLKTTQWYVADYYSETVKSLQISLDGVVTSIEGLHLYDEPASRKVLRDNQLIIINGDRTYNSFGIEIK